MMSNGDTAGGGGVRCVFQFKRKTNRDDFLIFSPVPPVLLMSGLHKKKPIVIIFSLPNPNPNPNPNPSRLATCPSLPSVVSHSFFFFCLRELGITNNKTRSMEIEQLTHGCLSLFPSTRNQSTSFRR